jgi:hypothetical protein
MALLVYADADGVERQITVGAEPVTVGRATECVIRSTDPRVSRNHARFFVDQHGTLYVEDLGSSNGVWIGPNKVAASMVPMNELVLVGSLAFRLVPSQPEIQRVEWQQQGTEPQAAPWLQGQQGAPLSTPQPDPSALLEAERKARKGAEEERDAYGARMAELHGEVRTLKAQLDTTAAELAKARIPAAAPDIQKRIMDLEEERTALTSELEVVRERANVAEARVISIEEELGVAREDAMKAEERVHSEVRAHEERSANELKSRVEELEVTRADLMKAEERILDLSRTVSELEAKVRELQSALSGRID